MRLRFLSGLVLILIAFAACQGPPPTQFVLVVTATPEGGDPQGNTTDATTAFGPLPTSGFTATPAATATATLTPTPDPFPTPTRAQLQVAEERFEHGRMFWLQPNDQIWVVVEAEDGSQKWSVYADTFVEGEVEFDPTLEPPEEGLQQPIRGFGKLWRENLEVQEALGWAVDIEYGYIANYEYHPGGTVDENNVYTQEPGYHLITSMFGDSYRFNEADGTWERVE